MNQCQFVLIVFTSFIYIQLLYIANCQYTTIWSDDFSTRDTGWRCGNGGTFSDLQLPIDWTADSCYLPYYDGNNDADYCQNAPCALLCAIGGERKNWWLERSTNIAAYSALQLEFSANGWKMYNPSKCQIWYSYDGATPVKSWEESGDDAKWFNQQIDLRSSNGSASSVTIKLQIYANSNNCNEACYFDNVALKGIPVTMNPTPSPANNPTPSPTYEPTSNPKTNNPTAIPTTMPTTSYPTNQPNVSPTQSPTEIPTNFPTHFPTGSPSFWPSNIPTNFPTFTPSNIPTNFPSNFPTNFPTLTPSNIPTKFPTNIPTNIPTNFPTNIPSNIPTNFPTLIPSNIPTNFPTLTPSNIPTNIPTNFTIDFTTSYIINQTTTNGANAITVITSVLCVIVCMCIIIYYAKYRKKLKNFQKLNELNDDHYVELVDIYTRTDEGDVETTKSTVSLKSAHDNEGDEDDIYEYVSPTNEGDVEVITAGHVDDEINCNDKENENMLQEKNTAGSFAQILNDNVMGVDLIMDDIVHDMDTNK